MEVKIRELDPATIKKIDTLAKKNNQSRQVYLKAHLEAFAVNDLHTDIIRRYEDQLDLNMILLEKTNTLLEKISVTFEDLIDDE